jgi:uncharacterized tellurite resistance protein B-like protein
MPLYAENQQIVPRFGVIAPNTAKNGSSILQGVRGHVDIAVTEFLEFTLMVGNAVHVHSEMLRNRTLPSSHWKTTACGTGPCKAGSKSMTYGGADRSGTGIVAKHSAEDYEDLGNYFQGLLQIMAVDNNLHEKQKDRIRAFALSQGFEKGYIEKAIETVLDNRHIPRIPPKFHSSQTARLFLVEAAHVAVCDGELHPLESDWILRAARRNGLDISFIQRILETVPLLSQSDPD